MSIKKLPSMAVTLTSGKCVPLEDCKGKPLVLFFYPKANTSGCTREASEFNDLIFKFRRQSTVVLGVSRDSLKTQQNFKTKLGLGFELIADPDQSLCKRFDVIKEKNMYGRKVMGIERSTFLFNADGRLVREWRKVRVDGHAQDVLEQVKSL